VPAAEDTATERLPRHGGEVERLGHREKIALWSAFDQAVGDLQAGEASQPVRVGQGDRLRDKPRRRVGDAQVEDLA
jgi:hypothetical protein